MARLGSPLQGVDADAAERTLSDPVAALVFVKDVALLLKDCALDARVPRQVKWVLGVVALYLLSPVDLVPDVIPILGQLDDLGLALWALRRLLQAAGPAVVHDLWRGSDDGLALVLSVAGMSLRKDEA
ncbi:MAG TPA: DUF1232 domain-containing protein [Euzebyales bacterium]|nr:DUF1232 domain-containing protein [Euzebyales bacterium]